MLCKFNVGECDQKQLYFKICNVLSLERKDTTITGIYAIYKNDICLYVGQSKNLASRISTHLSGKYKEADFIYMVDVEQIGFGDYRNRCEKSKKSILDNCEKYLIKLLKPIENIIADFNFQLPIEQTPDIHDYLPYSYIIDNREMSIYGDITIQDSNEHTVTNCDWLRICIHFLEKKDEDYKDLLDNYNTIFIKDIEVSHEH